MALVFPKGDSRPLSLQTGYLYSVYLRLKRLAATINEYCEYLEQTEPWYDKEPKTPKTF